MELLSNGYPFQEVATIEESTPEGLYLVKKHSCNVTLIQGWLFLRLATMHMMQGFTVYKS